MSTRPNHAEQKIFACENGQLLIANEPLHTLANRVGQTPFYAYERRAIDTRIAELRAALPASIQLHYAIKANPLPGVVRHIAKQIDGLDVASLGELQCALASDMQAQNISFAGPGKRAEELEAAVTAGILINLESRRELQILHDIAQRRGKRARVAVRVNPDYELKSSGMKMGGGPKPFGIDAEEVPAVLQEIGKLDLDFEGFHIFAGSQNLKAESIVEAQQLGYKLALQLATHAPSPVRSINLGGGFGIPYFAGEQALDLSPIATNLAQLTTALARELPDAHIVLELGRYIVGEAGIYVARILDRKVSRGTTFLVTDGGLHHHLAASGNFGQVIRKNYPVQVFPGRLRAGLDNNTTQSMSIVGPLCTPLDILADQIECPAWAEPGDLVVVFQSGAYGASASPQGFLSHPALHEYLL